MVEKDLMMKSKLSLGNRQSFIINIFNREDEKNTDGSEKEITYGEYVDKINRRALEEQKKII